MGSEMCIRDSFYFIPPNATPNAYLLLIGSAVFCLGFLRNYGITSKEPHHATSQRESSLVLSSQAIGARLHPTQGQVGARSTAALSAYYWDGHPIKVSSDGDVTVYFKSNDLHDSRIEFL